MGRSTLVGEARSRSEEATVEIGKPKRIIEIEPTSVPLPEALPIPDPLPTSTPEPAEPAT
jgi:hypothetical protein